MRKNSVKNTRVNGEVQRVLAEIIRGEIKDPRISPWTSVVAVEVAPDLKSCKAWISVLGGEETREATLQGLKSAEGFIKMKLAKKINLRNTPDITFVMDQSIEYGVNMSHKIDEVIARDGSHMDETEDAEFEEMDADEADEMEEDEE
ncbi:MAG: 30S ribosome-binding factor RbfA [Lachnospiraceae bacterium]|nr:30S ribosome-binding factor RbfA [Lachnospiraceae bacterium]